MIMKRKYFKSKRQKANGEWQEIMYIYSIYSGAALKQWRNEKAGSVIKTTTWRPETGNAKRQCQDGGGQGEREREKAAERKRRENGNCWVN